MMLYKHTNSTLDMSSPPTHSPAIILSGIVPDVDVDDDDRAGRKQLGVVVPLRLQPSPPASANPRERKPSYIAFPVLNTFMHEARGAAMKDVDPEGSHPG